MSPRPHPSADVPPTNDPLTARAVEAGEWGSPGWVDDETPAELPPAGFDYSGGMFTPSDDAVTYPVVNPQVLRLTTDAPASFQTPHEATHRRYEPPFRVGINQAAAGYTLLAPSLGLHYVKILSAFIALDAAGTLKFTEGAGLLTDPGIAGQGSPMGGIPIATNGGFVLPPADPTNPWLFTAPDQALGLFTATGKAFGWVMCCYSPYDS